MAVEVVRVQFRDAMRGEWTSQIEAGTGSTVSANGVTQIFGARPGSEHVTQLAAFPDSTVHSISFEPAQA